MAERQIENAIIASVFLGTKDCPGLTAYLHLDYGGGGQTVTYMIDDRPAPVEVVSDFAQDNADLLEPAQDATVVKLVN